MGAEIFLSYSHKDDAYPSNWVQQLKEELDRVLDTKMGHLKLQYKPEIFIDTDPRGDEPATITERVRKALQEASVFLCVTSNNYANSAWCQSEVAVFWEKPRHGDPRIIKVAKEPKPDGPRFDKLDGIDELKFYALDGSYDELESGKRNREIMKLATLIAANVNASRQPPKGRVVVLAGPGRGNHLEFIKRSLAEDSYAVWPDALPDDTSWRQQILRECLGKAVCTVLLLGNGEEGAGDASPSSKATADIAFAFKHLEKTIGNADGSRKRCLVCLPDNGSGAERGPLVQYINDSNWGGFGQVGPNESIWENVKLLLAEHRKSARRPTIYLYSPEGYRSGIDEVVKRFPSDFEILDPHGAAARRFKVESEANEAHGLLLYSEKTDLGFNRAFSTVHRVRTELKAFYRSRGTDLDLRLPEGYLSVFPDSPPQDSARSLAFDDFVKRVREEFERKQVESQWR
jgi:hypothetical protein